LRSKLCEEFVESEGLQITESPIVSVVLDKYFAKLKIVELISKGRKKERGKGKGKRNGKYLFGSW